ncbi:glycoside hydrolase family 2 protein [Palleniella intestinalis]|jgi:Beta-galactosidase/beta-glucuronidase|uniref:glycoside hydrolase family 2 protein n=1 Tax=Palleniella intestinalis TaxID=2736291 RepID=UPI0020A69E2B|nr:glycoside hydrolase family 2 TIM barrel-domain containing protein [Palleniella intestinalis]
MAQTTTETILLSGQGCDDTKPWRFTVTDGMRKGKRSTIQVPSCWELQGFGAYTYGRWYTKKGERPSMESGIYELDFTVPAKWNGKVVEINFEGVMTDAEVCVNGLPAGDIHRGAFTPFSYDISDKVRYGKRNHLRVKVDKESSNKSINAAERKADWWLFGGIYRPVTLTAKPKCHIRRATIDARADGRLNIQLLTSMVSDGYTLEASVEGLGKRSATVKKDSCMVTMDFPSPCQWTPETPHLYSLHLTLRDAKGTPLHSIGKRIGFRTVEFREGDGFYLNGTKLLINGVNRHCFYPETGRTSSKARDIEDVKLIKAMNANAIRSHYPPDSHLLDICDSLGMLYLNELAGWQNPYDNANGPRILKEMITRDASHPCIFAWSNGNEGGFNYNLDPLFDAYDPQHRHVVHAWALWNGVDAHHYPAFQTGAGRLRNGTKVFMPTEFLHAQYDKGGGASLYDYWVNWRQSPLFAGGFIWAWADEGIARTDRNGAIDTDGPNGPDGIVGPYREKEGSYWAIRDIWAPVQISPFVINDKWNGRIMLTNDYLFTDLSQCTLAWEWQSLPAAGGETNTISSGSMRLPQAAPGESRHITLQDVRPAKGLPAFLQLHVLSPQKDTILTRSYPACGAEALYSSLGTKENGKATLQTDDETITLCANNVKCEFAKSTALLRKVTCSGKETAFNNGPLPVGFKAKLKSVGTRTEGNDALLIARYSGGIDSIVWRMKPSGILEMDAVLLNDRRGHGYEGKFLEPDARNIGLTFSYPEEQCRGMRWLGNGPYRVWRNRRQGTRLGLWENTYNNTITGELPIDSALWKKGAQKPQTHLVYPEFKGFYSDMYWAEIQSEESPFTVYCATEGTYFRIFTPQEPVLRRDGKRTMERFPEGDMSFLIDIAPIQSYKPLEQLGPQAMVPTVRINLGDEGLPLRLRFDFRR